MAERLREECHLAHAIIQTCNEAIVAINRQGIVTVFNPAAERLFGRQEEFTCGTSIIELVAESLQEDFKADINSLIETFAGTSVASRILETTGCCSDGTTFPLTLSPSVGSQNEQVIVSFIARNSSGNLGVEPSLQQQKETEERLQSLVEQLEHVNQELTNFAYIVSHDLKAPLRGIKTVSEWLVADYAEHLDDQGREYLDTLTRRVDRMRSLIEGVLAYSRVGRQFEQLEQIELNQSIHDIIEYLSPPDHIMVTVEDELPCLWIEPTRLIHLFQGLIGNAIQFMNKSPGFIKIGCVEQDEHWQFSVADNGPGIEADQHERIFEIFQMLMPRDRQENTGVGLTIAKKIVELYGGRIWVESTPGQGSTFFFTLSKSVQPSPESPSASIRIG
ncbi:ATP-binding protein [Planctomycetota bacterium]